MSAKTGISWTDATWNPVAGCSLVSAGCTNCYAMQQAHRFDAVPGSKYEGLTEVVNGRPVWNGKVRLWPKHLDQPMRWKHPRKIFVNSMTDLFHEGLSNEEIAAVFGVMAACQQHTFQVLTKRPERMVGWFEWAELRGVDGLSVFPHDSRDWRICQMVKAAAFRVVDLSRSVVPKREPRWPLPNLWIGVSIEDQKTADERIPMLLQTPAAVRFVSYEPALGPVDLQPWLRPTFGPGMAYGPSGLGWVIFGGESGGRSRPCDIDWALSVIRQCRDAQVPIFIKQLGSQPVVEEGVLAEHAMGMGFVVDDCGGIHLRHRSGDDPSDWPSVFRIQQFPESRT